MGKKRKKKGWSKIEALFSFLCSFLDISSILFLALQALEYFLFALATGLVCRFLSFFYFYI